MVHENNMDKSKATAKEVSKPRPLSQVYNLVMRTISFLIIMYLG